MTSRKCIECGCWHERAIHVKQIEEIIEELQYCHDCLLRQGWVPYIEKIIIDERPDEKWPMPERIHTAHGASLIKISLDDKDEDKR